MALDLRFSRAMSADTRQGVPPKWFLAIAYSAFLSSLALLVPLVFQYSTYPKRVVFMVMLFSGLLGLVTSLAFRWSLLRVDRKILVPALLSALVISLVAWVYTVLTATEPDYIKFVDGQVYVVMAQSLLDQGTFLRNGVPTEHYGPLYPLFLVPFYVVSRDILATKAAILVMGAAAAAAVFCTTRRLYGGKEALLATTLVFSNPTLLLVTSRNMAEFLLVMLYALTIYCLHRSLEKGAEKQVVLAGLFAGLAYLTKSSLGYLFLVAAAAGFLWRFRYARWGVLRDRHYLTAAALFLALVGAWVVRNIVALWRPYMGRQAFIDRWNGDFYFNAAFGYAIPGRWELFTLQTIIFGGFMVPVAVAYLWPFLPDLRRALGKLREERMSMLLWPCLYLRFLAQWFHPYTTYGSATTPRRTRRAT